MKSLAFLVFLFLLVPGSGRLIWDGLPLSTRAEFALLVTAAVAMFSKEVRDYCRSALHRLRLRSFVTPFLLLLCVIKFFTFAYAPMSQGFEACYQSLYNPIPTTTDGDGESLSTCEKSYEGPFLPSATSGFTNTSRVDSVVDFGRRPYDWSLPFMNDYPRLGNLWLTRFPFVATYVMNVTVTRDDDVLPVYSIGELSVTINGSPVAETSNYDRHVLTAVKLPRGTSEVVVRFQYRDDLLAEPPDEPSIPRGPYAALKIGAPLPASDLVPASSILLTGTVSRASPGSALTALIVRDERGSVVATQDLNELPRETSGGLLRTFDLELSIPSSALVNSPLEILTSNEEGEESLGTITAGTESPLSASITQTADARTIVDLATTITADRSSFDVLRPDTRSTPGLLLRLLLALLDLLSFGVFALMLAAIVRTTGNIVLQALGIAAVAWILIEPVDAILPGFVGGGRELVIPYAVISLLVLATHRQIRRFPLVYLLPISAVLASQKIFDHVQFNHPEVDGDWWGKLVFLWRDSDWLANTGNARATFVEGSLRGGESVFWFRAGPRYLLMLLHVLLGENDVLIGLVSLTVGFLLIWLLAAKFVAKHGTILTAAVGWFVLFISQIFLADQITTAFAFFISSEYPTWLVFFGVTAFLLGKRPEERNWVTTGFALAVAATVHFRPNGVFVAFALLPLLVFHSWRAGHDGLRRVGWALAAFLSVIPLSLIHNLYYGKEFVIFTPNPSSVLGTSFADIYRDSGVIELLRVVWRQWCGVMYWRIPHDANFAIFFWGAQLVFLLALVFRARRHVMWKSTTLIALVPLTYVLPMLQFTLDSYYPRLLVSASLLCLCCGLLIWPKATSMAHQDEHPKPANYVTA